MGNTGNGTREITIDANLPGLRINTVAGDDVVNIIEHGQALVITGSSSGLAAGSNVTLTINGQTYVAAVLADGAWSVGVRRQMWAFLAWGRSQLRPAATPPPEIR